MGRTTSVIAICESDEHAELAMNRLGTAGVDMLAISTATKDVFGSTYNPGYNHFGAQTFLVPGIGPLLVVGPLTASINAELGGAAAGQEASLLCRCLAGVGIPRDSILEYETALEADKCVLVVQGSPNDILIALKVIGGTSHCSHTVHGEEASDTVYGATLPGVSAYPYQA